LLQFKALRQQLGGRRGICAAIRPRDPLRVANSGINPIILELAFPFFPSNWQYLIPLPVEMDQH